MNYYTIITKLTLKQRIKNAIKSFFVKETSQRVYDNPLSQLIYDNPGFIAQNNIAFGLCDGFSITLDREKEIDYTKPYEPTSRESLLVVEFNKDGKTIAKSNLEQEGLNIEEGLFTTIQN